MRVSTMDAWSCLLDCSWRFVCVEPPAGTSSCATICVLTWLCRERLDRSDDRGGGLRFLVWDTFLDLDRRLSRDCCLELCLCNFTPDLPEFELRFLSRRLRGSSSWSELNSSEEELLAYTTWLSSRRNTRQPRLTGSSAWLIPECPSEFLRIEPVWGIQRWFQRPTWFLVVRCFGRNPRVHLGINRNFRNRRGNSITKLLKQNKILWRKGVDPPFFFTNRIGKLLLVAVFSPLHHFDIFSCDRITFSVNIHKSRLSNKLTVF